MKLKIMLLIVCLVTPAKEFAQTVVNRTIPVPAGVRIAMDFDYPELIRLSTWERNEISIQGSVSINGGENDEAFLLESSTGGDVVSITSEIKDLKNLPRRITLNRDGQKIIFRDKAELRKYQAEHGSGYNVMSMGPDIEIKLDIKVPRNFVTHVRSVYGVVEVRDFTGPLTVDATYGGVDASLSERAVGELRAETNYGQIYTNLDIRFTGEQVESRDFHTQVSAKPGTGPTYNFESKYGNVYLRKQGN